MFLEYSIIDPIIAGTIIWLGCEIRFARPMDVAALHFVISAMYVSRGVLKK